jgi:hypothetical protein
LETANESIWIKVREETPLWIVRCGDAGGDHVYKAGVGFYQLVVTET